MIRLKHVNQDIAEELIDFSGKNPDRAELGKQQLQGSVAIYNLLKQHGFAYLSDEVGMGKTYVALGVAGLIKHFHPEARILYIVPRANIQYKWDKEFQNFARNNWRQPDFIVQSIGGAPAGSPTMCENLLDLVHLAGINRNRDFLVRMTSFSFGLSGDDQTGGWSKKLDQLKETIPWVDKRKFPTAQKDAFKNVYAAYINAALPKFDLVIVDEGHNLKHGFHNSPSARNRLLGIVLGQTDDELDIPELPGAGVKADRVLVLSATPAETDFSQVWKQMELLGKPDVAPELIDSEATLDAKKTATRRFMIRRLTGLDIAGKRYTKNMYRNEWRYGGVQDETKPIEITDQRQRLIVALAQKKVSDIITARGQQKGGKFSRSFQMGMLASFESFFQTSKTLSPDGDESATFDQQDQAKDYIEKEGIDAASISNLASSYREIFHTALPHPKMDQVAASLAKRMFCGQKSLVFVRRIATVPELQAKVNEYYDEWITDYIRSQLPSALVSEFDQIVQFYIEKIRTKQDVELVGSDGVLDSNEEVVRGSVDDPGATDNFFTWFFRGNGPRGWLSGAAFRDNRLKSEGAILSTVFEDNYVLRLLDDSSEPLSELASRTEIGIELLSENLRRLAYASFRQGSIQKKFPKLRVYRAYQNAALHLLASSKDTLANAASVVLHTVFKQTLQETHEDPPDNFPEVGDFLSETTFFSELDRRPRLAKEILAPISGWELQEIQVHEKRKEMLVSAITLGHPMVDLWLAGVRQLESLKQIAKDQKRDTVIAYVGAVLNRIETQAEDSGLNTFRELSLINKNFELICDVNFPGIQEISALKLSQIYQNVFGRQTPVAGMFGGVNIQQVNQFRNPGYPVVMIATDVLQEGEDLHTFCSDVIHYGISWTPSSIEQRTGRIDRIASETHRRLGKLNCNPKHSELLQVKYPYLDNTVEFLQVNTMFHRMNRFIEMLHDNIVFNESYESEVDVSREIIREVKVIPPIEGELHSSFEIDPELLHPQSRILERVKPDTSELILKHFDELWETFCKRFDIQPPNPHERHQRVAKICIKDENIAELSECDPNELSPVTLNIRATHSSGDAVLSCRYDIGQLDLDRESLLGSVAEYHKYIGTGKICADEDPKNRQLHLYVEEDILFSKQTTQYDEFEEVIQRAGALAQGLKRVIQHPRAKRHAIPESSDNREATRKVLNMAANIRQLPNSKLELRVVSERIRIYFENGRHQDISIHGDQRRYIFESVALSSKRLARLIPDEIGRFRCICRYNTLTDVVSFSINAKGDLVGRIEQLVRTLDQNELIFYVSRLAEECDRLEYLLTSEDVN
ncbi:DEAD/DEAH box helicase family protein [bacterium]|nr:DEAD/DEAH box helicase family protein [bacterium]